MSQVEVLMPSMGEGVTEATLVKWLKKPGDKVDEDEPLLEVSTDKVDTEIPSPSAGFILDLRVGEGDTIVVDQILAILGEEGGQAAASPPAKKQAPEPAPIPVTTATDTQQTTREEAPLPKTAAASPIPASDTRPARKLAKSQQVATNPLLSRSSPVVRKMAKDKGIDLSTVIGTGIQGRITKNDLEIHLKETSKKATTRKIPGSDKRPKAAPDPVAKPKSVSPDSSQAKALVVSEPKGLATTFNGEDEYLDGVLVAREKMTKMRSLIAEHMVESVRTSPHVTTVFEIDLKKIVSLRDSTKDKFLSQEGFKLTFTPFLLHAAIQAIKKFPIVNASLDGNDILFKKDINLGCAVALENGLIVPVIKQAGELNLNGIARKLNDLVVRARSKKLKPDDVRGGTFTVTNPGGYGSITSNPIINQPQVAILGIGAIVKKPVVVEDDAIAIRPMMLMSLTFDHRVIDGEVGALFLAEMKKVLENYAYTPL